MRVAEFIRSCLSTDDPPKVFGVSLEEMASDPQRLVDVLTEVVVKAPSPELVMNALGAAVKHREARNNLDAAARSAESISVDHPLWKALHQTERELDAALDKIF